VRRTARVRERERGRTCEEDSTCVIRTVRTTRVIVQSAGNSRNFPYLQSISVTSVLLLRYH
jgi:hypothetical protein